ncbi:transcriptional regulator with XRE-family HTH domain [Sulfitobacter undariae]|uniref:Transcriptional regulator with XRE-family HTH domain n=1 Tax=Sulfitobacter undariae TaxID=1563671 RepID=A0A7W6ECN5_9RHOB|nr:helix-turn-helix transcriptional regulator [Sulfitobacter undariae]MBB3995339.1 transcriptional regulator with XRE-family HTH domain [Sulfitobacter undariae]
MAEKALSPREIAERFRSTLVALVEQRSSISEVCRRAGVNRQQFNKYMNGSNMPSIGVACRIAEALNVSVSELVGEKVFMETGEDTRLDTLFERHVDHLPRYMKAGGYLEVAALPESKEQVLIAGVELCEREIGGSYRRYAQVTRTDGTSVYNELLGRYYEAGGKLVIYYTNVTFNNVLGATCLRKVDYYSDDWVGLKTAHRFQGAPKPASGIVLLLRVGEIQDLAPMKDEFGIHRLEELPPCFPERISRMMERHFDAIKASPQGYEI